MRPKPGIETIQPYQGGKPIEEVQRELGISDIIKLASNENPLGPSPLAMQCHPRCSDTGEPLPRWQCLLPETRSGGAHRRSARKPDFRERLQRGAATGRGDLHIAGRRSNLFGECLCRLYASRQGFRCELNHHADVRLYAGPSERWRMRSPIRPTSSSSLTRTTRPGQWSRKRRRRN